MRLDLYIFREWLKIFSLAVAAILGLLLLSEIYNELPRFIDRKAPLNEVLLFFALLIPGYLPSLLPICFLLSLLFSLATLQRNGEIVAMRATGISLFRLSRSFWIAASLLAGLLLWLNASLGPISLERALHIRETVKEVDLAKRTDIVRGSSEALAVFLPEANELWFVEVLRRSNMEAFGVSVELLTEEGSLRHEAAQAYYDWENKVWILEEGITLRLLNGADLPDALENFDRLELSDSQMTPIVLIGYSQEPEDLPLNQLSSLLEETKGHPYSEPYRARYLSVISAPFQFFVVVLIALPCALGSGRSRASGGFFRAVWIYLVFFAVLALFSLAGQRGYLPALAAAWTPFAIATAAGVWMYKRNA